VRIGADESLKGIKHWVVGANEDGYHYVGAEQGRDFTVDFWADLCTAKAGDSCPECGKPITLARGIEVGQIFELGDKYSKTMGATFSDEDGKERPFIMGCYGIGVSRSMAAVVEQYNDEYGIKWPATIAPAHVCILPLSVNDDLVLPTAEKLAGELSAVGLEVVIDDRKERPGVKFADADLIGWPLQIILGKRGLSNGVYEVKNRHTGDRFEISVDEFNDIVSMIRHQPALASAALRQLLEESQARANRA
jgi:prolyl-tRNA synthetase